MHTKQIRNITLCFDVALCRIFLTFSGAAAAAGGVSAFSGFPPSCGYLCRLRCCFAAAGEIFRPAGRAAGALLVCSFFRFPLRGCGWKCRRDDLPAVVICRRWRCSCAASSGGGWAGFTVSGWAVSGWAVSGGCPAFRAGRRRDLLRRLEGLPVLPRLLLILSASVGAAAARGRSALLRRLEGLPGFAGLAGFAGIAAGF